MNAQRDTGTYRTNKKSFRCLLPLADQRKKNVEEQGIDPCASCMLSKRSTI